jgi:periplasmic divalent cation tolerance protein
MDYALITTRIGTEAEATALMEKVVGERLAACAQMYPVQSHYWWEGKLTHSAEIAIHFKTTGKNVDALQSLIAKHHPYQVPQILVYEIREGHQPYLDWLDTETI